MTKDKSSKSARPEMDGRTLLVRLLCLTALSVSGYLLYGALTGERLAGCGLESGCDKVLRTRWAYLFGLPVSLPAALLYCGLIGATFHERLNGKAQDVARNFLVFGAAALMAAAIYFVSLQLFVIGSICRFCMAAHACGFLAGAILLAPVSRSKIAPRILRKIEHPPVPGQPGTAIVLLGGFAVVGLVAVGQLVYQPKMFSISSSSSLAKRKAAHLVQLHGGAFAIDLDDTPLLGSPDAPCVVMHLFDYTCPHCRQLHPMLEQAHQVLSNRVVFASLLAPLATNCNPYLTRPLLPHLTACDLAYAGLAVWRAKPEKLPEFEQWIFTEQLPPAPDAVRAKGRELVGTNAFNQALKDPWIRNHVARNINLYATNYVVFRKSVLPELMVGTNIVSGTLRSVDDLYRLIGTQCALDSAQTNYSPSIR